MFLHGKSAKIYWNGYDLTAFLNSIGLNTTGDVAETSTFGLTSKTFVSGLVNATLTIDGLYSDASGEGVDLLNQALAASSNHTILIFPQGDTIGLDGWGMVGVGTGMTVPVNLTSAVMVQGAFQSSVAAELLVSHHALGAETGTAGSTSVDGAAATTTGGVGYLEVTAFVGSNITVKVQDSADNSSFADILSFTAVTAANSKERKTLAAGATVRRYTRDIRSGTFTSCTYAMAFSRSPRA
jgi:hypothetical protein